MYLTDEEKIYVESVFSENRHAIEHLFEYYHMSHIYKNVVTNVSRMINTEGRTFARLKFNGKDRTFYVENGYDKLLTITFNGLTYDQFWSDSRETYFIEICDIMKNMFDLRVDVVRP